MLFFHFAVTLPHITGFFAMTIHLLLAISSIQSVYGHTKGGTNHMFYIDYTTPEGKTYRIDIEKHPVIYECPVCGEKTIYELEEYCGACLERQEQEEAIKRSKESLQRLVGRVNATCHSNITEDTIKEWSDEIRYLTPEETAIFIRGKLQELREKYKEIG